MHSSGLAAVTALVAARTPPSTWGQQDAEREGAPPVGLTQAEQVWAGHGKSAKSAHVTSYVITF